MKKNERVNIRLTPEQKLQLYKEARKRKKSITKLILEALKQYFRGYNEK